MTLHHRGAEAAKQDQKGEVNVQPDDKICYCFDVPLRKLVNFARRERPKQPSRMTECLGAGSGCGWCIPFLEKIAENPDNPGFVSLTPEDYETQRGDYIKTDQPKNRF